jgi:hypothetical protein
LEDSHIASVFSLGIRSGFAARSQIVQWADREISARSEPPLWILDLAMSEQSHVLDVISLLKNAGGGNHADPIETIRVAYALLPDTLSFDYQASAYLAGQIYRVTCDALGADWSQPMVSDACWLADEFQLVEEGYSTLAKGDLMNKVDELVRRYRSPDVVRRLEPVRWIVGGAALSE